MDMEFIGSVWNCLQRNTSYTQHFKPIAVGELILSKCLGRVWRIKRRHTDESLDMEILCITAIFLILRHLSMGLEFALRDCTAGLSLGGRISRPFHEDQSLGQ